MVLLFVIGIVTSPRPLLSVVGWLNRSVGWSVGWAVCLSFPKKVGSYTSMLLSEHLFSSALTANVGGKM